MTQLHIESILKKHKKLLALCVIVFLLFSSYEQVLEFGSSCYSIVFFTKNPTVIEGSTPHEEWGRKALLNTCYQYKNSTATNICCLMHSYNSSDTQRCCAAVLKSEGFNASSRTKLSIVIIGDSRARQIFYSFAYLMADTNSSYTEQGVTLHIAKIYPQLLTLKPHSHISLNSEMLHLTVHFYWDPFLTDFLPQLLKQWLNQPETRPHLLQLGSGVHYMLFRQPSAAKEFVELWGNILPSLSALANNTHIIVKLIDYVLVNYLKPDWQKELQDAKIDQMNLNLSSVLHETPNDILIMNSTTHLSTQYVDQCYTNKQSTDDSMWTCNDYLHVGYVVIHQARNMILNSFCNKYLQLTEDYCS